MRLIYVATLCLFFMTYSEPILATEYHFCLLSDRGNKNVTSKEGDDVTFDQAAKDAEQRYCAEFFALVCAAIDYNSDTCGASETERMDFTNAQVQFFNENPDGSPAVRTDAVASLTIAVTPDSMGLGTTIRSAVDIANEHLKTAQCPAHFVEGQQLKPLPDPFANFRVSDLASLRSIARYPGTIKVVPDISFCNSPDAVKTIDKVGRQRVLECPSTEYSSIVLTPEAAQITAILILMGYGQLAGITEDVSNGKEYSLSDFDLLIPESKLLAGEFSAFHVTREQCVRFATYALRQLALRGH